ncbi:MAG: SPOR domain-containing protein [Prevotella sp.]|nr:SPOR domain-containing protein [Prevotella sp.]
MKKYVLVCAGICLAMSLASCGSSEKKYRQAYEKAQSQVAQQQVQQQQQQQQQQPVVTETPVVTPVQTVPSTQTQVVDNLDNVQVRQERVTIVSGAGLKAYSVVVGAFSVIANAEKLQSRLQKAGYGGAQIVKNEERNMYRVVAATFADKASAVQCRDQLRQSSDYADAWLLYSGQ